MRFEEEEEEEEEAVGMCMLISRISEKVLEVFGFPADGRPRASSVQSTFISSTSHSFGRSPAASFSVNGFLPSDFINSPVAVPFSTFVNV